MSHNWKKNLVYRVRKKVLEKNGFSLSELLLATLIMLLATGILTSTISLAAGNYDKMIKKNQSDILCESLAYAVRDKLSGTVKYVPNADENEIRYYSTSSNLEYYPFCIKNDNGVMYLQYKDFPGYDSTSSSSGRYYLVDAASYMSVSGSDSHKYKAAYKVDREPDSGNTISYFKVKIAIFDANEADVSIANVGDSITSVDFVVYPMSVVNVIE